MCLLCWAKLRRVMSTIHATLPRTSFLLIYMTILGTCPGSRYCTCNGAYLPPVSYSRIPSCLHWRSWAHRQTGLSVIFPFPLVCVSSGDVLWDGHTHSRVHPRHTPGAHHPSIIHTCVRPFHACISLDIDRALRFSASPFSWSSVAQYLLSRGVSGGKGDI